MMLSGEGVLKIINAIKEQKRTEFLVDKSGWKEYKLSDIFKNVANGAEVIKDTEDGDIFLISSTESNNGIVKKIKNGRKLFNGNKLTLAKNGSVGTVFYQDKDFYATSDVMILDNINLNKNIALFLLPKLGK